MKISIISALLMCAVFTSCQDDPIVTALQEKGIDVDQVSDIVSRSGNDKSPEELLHELQTDKMGMLISNIVLVNNEYQLLLSIDEAHELGISDSLYMIASNIVQEYNNLK